MDEKIYTEISILVEYPAAFRKSVADAEMPGNLLKIKVNDEFIIGSKDSYTECPLMGSTFIEALEGIIRILNHEKSIVEFHSGGGTLLIIEPRDERTVNLTPAFSQKSIDNPEKRIFESKTVKRKLVISEIIRVSKEWKNRSIHVNKEIIQTQWFNDFEKALTEAESARAENG